MASLTNIDKMKLGIRARNDARREREAQFEREHPGLFQEMIERNRVTLGLPRRPQGDSPEEIEEKLRRAEARAEKLRRDLQAYRR